ncbi:hypothetical protein E0K83_12410 [Gramella sp. BOM4]|nr:hypothetical protein [Christiangramia bathymodioli]
MGFKNKYAEFWTEDGILFFVYKANTVIDLKAAESIVKDRIRFQNEKELPILCDMRQLHIVEKPARDYLAAEGSYLAKAVALVVKELYTEKLVDVFLQTSKPSVPTRRFTSETKALEFLKQF